MTGTALQILIRDLENISMEADFILKLYKQNSTLYTDYWTKLTTNSWSMNTELWTYLTGKHQDQ